LRREMENALRAFDRSSPSSDIGAGVPAINVAETKDGFEVTAVDFAADAVAAMTQLADAQAPVQAVQADIFVLPPAFDHQFDTLLEYTCFCAIDPARRGEYVDVAERVLKPGGTYVARTPGKASAMRALNAVKFISTGALLDHAKDRPMRPSRTQRTWAMTTPRSSSCSGRRSPMLGTCGKSTIAPEDETLTSCTTCLRPRNSSTAVLDTAG